MTNVSVAIIINSKKKILIAQRKNSDDFYDYWEFPGGKINLTETPTEAVIRELNEELNLTVSSSCIDISNYLYQYDNGLLVNLHFFAIRYDNSCISLNVHKAIKWVDVFELQTYNLLPGDKFISNHLLEKFDCIFLALTKQAPYKGHISNLLVEWFTKEKRLLPFRESKDPYKIWVSEIMAQQTQIATLLPYYERFISSFPTIHDLAKATLDDVYKHWEGLGYYSRAKNLYKCANVIVNEYNGIFPSNYDILLSLPGIGPYTAGAISSIAFALPRAAVDGNVLRVIARLMDYHEDITKQKTKKIIGHLVESMMINYPPSDINEGLMELGASICTPSSPKCEKCPILLHCHGYKNKTCDILPVKKRKLKPVSRSIEVLIWQQADYLLFVKKNDKGLLSGLWGFPFVEATNLPGESIQMHVLTLFNTTNQLVHVGNCTHVFSHQIWKMEIYTNVPLPDYALVVNDSALPYLQEVCYKSRNDSDSLALSTAFNKALQVFLSWEK